jgi:uncharacterized membrane protein
LDVGLVVTRIIHILAGSFWVGAAIYLAILLEPRIRATPGDLERQFLNKTSKLNSLWITSAAVVTMLSGFALVSTTPGRSMSDIGSGGWGTMILIGIMTSVTAFSSLVLRVPSTPNCVVDLSRITPMKLSSLFTGAS